MFAPLIKDKGLAIQYRDLWSRCSHYVISLQKMYVVVLNEVKWTEIGKTCSKRLSGCVSQYFTRLFK